MSHRLCFAVAALCFLAALWGCAIRVAPVGDTYTKPDGKGGYITSLNPDLAQPKDDPQASDWLTMAAGLLPGPWGPLVAGLASLGTGAYAMRRRYEGTIGRISAGVHAFTQAHPDQEPVLLGELSKTMDTADKAVVRRVKPKPVKPPLAKTQA